jgi:hypothetical protein
MSVQVLFPHRLSPPLMMRLRSRSSSCAAILALVGIVPFASAAAQMPALVAVTPCGAAHSLFRSTSDDVHGLVRGWYRADQNATVVTTDGGIPQGIAFHVRYTGQRADSLPAAQLTLFLRAGKGTEALTEGEMPVVTATLNDSTRLELAPAQVGASRGGTIYIPVSAYVSPENLLAIARARTARFDVGPIGIALAPDSRRNLRALYHVALCGEAPAKPDR